MSLPYLYTPARASQTSLENIKARQEVDLYLTTGLSDLDDFLVPMLPGDLVSIYGRPGHGKTSFCLMVAKEAERVFLSRTKDKRYVLYATWETTVPEFTTLITASETGYSLWDVAQGKADMIVMERAMVSFLKGRMAIASRAVVNRKEAVRYGPVPNLRDIDGILSWMSKEGFLPGLLVLDYLQRIPHPSESNRSKAVGENCNLAKDLAIKYGIPVVQGVQASRDVDGYSGLKMPRLDDGQHSSEIEQASDKVHALTKPGTYMDHGTELELGGQVWKVRPSLLVVRNLKCRWGNAGKTFMVDFKWDRYEADMSKPEPDVF